MSDKLILPTSDKLDGYEIARIAFVAVVVTAAGIGGVLENWDTLKNWGGFVFALLCGAMFGTWDWAVEHAGVLAVVVGLVLLRRIEERLGSVLFQLKRLEWILGGERPHA